MIPIQNVLNVKSLDFELFFDYINFIGKISVVFSKLKVCFGHELKSFFLKLGF